MKNAPYATDKAPYATENAPYAKLSSVIGQCNFFLMLIAVALTGPCY